MTPSQSHTTLIISKSTVSIDQPNPSFPSLLKLSVSDLPMLSCHYIQKGCLFTRPNNSDFVSVIKRGLSTTLAHFPPLAGRLTTDADGYVYIACDNAGADFIHANAAHITLRDILYPLHVPDCIKQFFAFEGAISYEGHFKPILAVQVTELADGVFIGCSVNHAVVDGTSLWNFFNTFAEVCKKGATRISRSPDFTRDSVIISPAVLKIPDDGLKVTFDVHMPLKERIFSFSRESILKLKAKVDNKKGNLKHSGGIDAAELLAKQSNDPINGKIMAIIENWLVKNVLAKAETETIDSTVEISSFQSLCALLWRGVTRARKFPSNKTTTFRMAVNCRHRLEPKLDSFYFGNAIQSIPTYALAGDVLSRDLRWCAEQLNKNVKEYDNNMVRNTIENWERDPRCFPLGNFDGAMITMGSSPRFPMYENDFGWGKPLAIRSGRANKFDGKISAFPGREGCGSVDLEVVLAPETMAGLESDSEFMQFVSGY